MLLVARPTLSITNLNATSTTLLTYVNHLTYPSTLTTNNLNVSGTTKLNGSSTLISSMFESETVLDNLFDLLLTAVRALQRVCVCVFKLRFWSEPDSEGPEVGPWLPVRQSLQWRKLAILLTVSRPGCTLIGCLRLWFERSKKYSFAEMAAARVISWQQAQASTQSHGQLRVKCSDFDGLSRRSPSTGRLLRASPVAADPSVHATA
jgi:hypothetical protein